jgi:hypothetical protein
VAICEATWRKHRAKAAYVVQAAGDEYVTLPENEEDENADSLDDTKKPDINDMQWFLAKDEYTGLAKWPLSFKRLSKDTKEPNKEDSPSATKTPNAAPEQPPTAA